MCAMCTCTVPGFHGGVTKSTDITAMAMDKLRTRCSVRTVYSLVTYYLAVLGLYLLETAGVFVRWMVDVNAFCTGVCSVSRYHIYMLYSEILVCVRTVYS